MLNLANVSLRRYFLLALFLLLVVPIFKPTWHLCWLAPFLVVVWYQKEYVTALWYSVACGVLVDLLEPQLRFGFHAINYTVVTALLYDQRHNFFADRITTLPLMALFFSQLSTFVAMILCYLFTKNNALSWLSVSYDIFVMSLFDGVYASVIFTLPYLFMGKMGRKQRYHFLQRRHRS